MWKGGSVESAQLLSVFEHSRLPSSSNRANPCQTTAAYARKFNHVTPLWHHFTRRFTKCCACVVDRLWDVTQACVARSYVECSSGFRASVDYTMQLFSRITTQVCVERCFVESASGCVARLDALITPLITQDPDFSLSLDFCLCVPLI